MKRVQNIRIEIWKNEGVRNIKYEQVNLVLAVFASAFLNQVSITIY